jgi:hypothetical protein
MQSKPVTPDNSTLLDGERAGQVLITEAPAPGAGWP